MSAMVLCSACKRHVFAKEAACPFCGSAIRAEARYAQPALAPELSRAERYAIGAAIAVSVATTACSSPTTVHHPDDLNTVDVNAAPNGSANTQNQQVSPGSGRVLEVATDPDPNTNTLATDDQANDEARRRQEEQRRREAERRRQQQEDERFRREQQWRNRPPCNGNVCPPYGCVFPDEACDIVRA